MVRKAEPRGWKNNSISDTTFCRTPYSTTLFLYSLSLNQSDYKKRLMKEAIDVSLTHGKILHSFPLGERQEICIFNDNLSTSYVLFYVFNIHIYVKKAECIFMKLLHNYLHKHSYYVFL